MLATVKKTTVADVEKEPNFQELLDAYAKVMVVKDAPPFQARIEMYKHLEKIGALKVFGAYVEGKLIGFITALIPVLLHVSVTLAVAESFFVLESYRGSGAGDMLKKAAENHSRICGAFGILITAPTGGVLAEVLEKSDDYTETSRVFYRKL